MISGRLYNVLAAFFAIAAFACAFIPVDAQQMQPLKMRDAKTLSPQERLQLPDATRVSINGHVFTLAQLRKNHAALVASRNRVRTLRFSGLKSITGADHTFTQNFGVAHLVPLKLATPTPMPSALPLISNSLGVPWPSDYQTFCSSMPATVCLYYPAGVQWYGEQDGFFWTIDYMITDQNACSGGGGWIGSETGWGELNGAGCIYSYPDSQTVQFPPPKNGFTTTGWCQASPGYYTVTVDKHGAVQVADAGAHNTGAESFCFDQVRFSP